MILELIKVMSWGFSLSLPASSSSHSQKCVFLVQDANKLQLSAWCPWMIKVFHIHLFTPSCVDIHFPFQCQMFQHCVICLLEDEKLCLTVSLLSQHPVHRAKISMSYCFTSLHPIYASVSAPL